MDPIAPLHKENIVEQPQESVFDWREYYHAIRDRLWIIAICFVLGGVGAFLVLKDKQQYYQARSVLFILQSQNRVLGEVQSVQDNLISSIDMVNTVVENLRSYPMALRVAERMKLGTDPQFLAATAEGEKELTTEAVAGRLIGMVTPAFREETRLIDINARSTDPALATILANSYAEEYLRLVYEQRTEGTRAAGQFLLEEAERLGSKMRVSEEALQSFRERERAASLETMLTEAQTSVNEFSARQISLDKEIAQINADLAEAAQIGKDPLRLAKLPSLLADPRVARAIAETTAAQQQMDFLSQRYLSNHPEHVAAARRLQLKSQERDELLFSVVEQLSTLRDNLLAEQAELKKTRATAEERLLQVTSKSIEYNSLMRNLETDRTLYNSVMARLKEVDLTKGLTDMPVAIQEKAIGAAPVPIGQVKIFAMFLVMGLAAGVGIALLLNYMDPSIQTVDQAERWTGLSIIATVPKVGKITEGSGASALPVVADRKGLVAESFRTLRTSIALLGGRQQRQIFLFTSAVPAEGKTFSSTNFASTLAQQGFRTLLIDSDLRRPSVSKLLYSEHRRPGLTEVLMGRCGLSDAVIEGDLQNLSILTAGGRSENPAELLANKSLGEIIEEARKSFDRIVIDSAPVLAVSDTLLLAEHVDAACLVVRAHSTPKKSVLHAIRVLSETGREPTGILLNCLDTRAGYYAYSGRYHAGYGSKGVYGAKG